MALGLVIQKVKDSLKIKIDRYV